MWSNYQWPSSYILKDGNNNDLYVPWSCSGGTCPRKAANIADPAMRSAYITILQNDFDDGNYKGIFINDVFLELEDLVGNGYGDFVAPIDMYN